MEWPTFVSQSLLTIFSGGIISFEGIKKQKLYDKQLSTIIIKVNED